MNKRMGHRRAWIFAVVVAAMVAFAANAGKMLVVDHPEKSDLILVLAGETSYRPALALQLLSEGYGRRILLDVPADAKIYDFTELQLAEKYVRDLPQSQAIGICPIEGLSTKLESHDVEKCLARESETARILIVTSDYHTRRALSIFRHAIRGKSFSVAAAHEPPEFGTQWWTHRQWAKTCVNEWFRMFWWTAVDRWMK
jgi:hypothetical protein